MEENIYNLPPMRAARHERLEGLLKLVDESAEGDAFFDFPNYDANSIRRIGRAHARKLAEIDPTANKKFIPYLSYLYLQSGQEAKHRLLFEDNFQAAAYLWAVNVLQGARIPFSLDQSDARGNPVINASGMPSVLPLADVFEKIQPYRERLRRAPAYQNLADLDGDLAVQILILADPQPEMLQFGVDDPDERELLVGKNPSAAIIYQGKDFKFVKINDRKAARYYGRGTEWCTAWEYTHTHVDRYLSRGHLYTLFYPNSQHAYQLHFNEWQLTDEWDRESKLLDVRNTFDKKKDWDKFASVLLSAMLDDAADGLRLPKIPEELMPYITDEHRTRNAQVELAVTDAQDRQVRQKAFERLRTDAIYLSLEQREEHLVKLEENAGKLWHHLGEAALKFLTPADRKSYTKAQQSRMLAVDFAVSANSASLMKRSDKSQPASYTYIEPDDAVARLEDSRWIGGLQALVYQLPNLPTRYHEPLISRIEQGIEASKDKAFADSALANFFEYYAPFFDQPDGFSDEHKSRIWGMAKAAYSYNIQELVSPGIGMETPLQANLVGRKLMIRCIKACGRYPLETQQEIYIFNQSMFGYDSGQMAILEALPEVHTSLQGWVIGTATDMLKEARSARSYDHIAGIGYCLAKAAPQLDPQHDKAVSSIFKRLLKTKAQCGPEEMRQSVGSLTAQNLGAWYGTRLHEQAVDLIAESAGVPSRPTGPLSSVPLGRHP